MVGGLHRAEAEGALAVSRVVLAGVELALDPDVRAEDVGVDALLSGDALDQRTVLAPPLDADLHARSVAGEAIAARGGWEVVAGIAVPGTIGGLGGSQVRRKRQAAQQERGRQGKGPELFHRVSSFPRP
ncbi:hypothetical protein D3C72_1281720 [compost metagenome]